MPIGSLGRAQLEFSANTGKFNSDVGRAAARFNKAMDGMKRSIGNFAGALIAGLGVRAFTGFIQKQIDLADQTAKMSQKLGVSTEALSMYVTAASLAGVESATLQKGMQKLAQNQADLALGTGDAIYAFNALGIGVKDFTELGGDTAAMFELVAGKLASFEDGANKTALAMKVFGKSGAEMIPLFNSLEATRKEAAELGLVIGGPVAKAAEEFNDEMNRSGRAMDGLGQKIIAELLPEMTALAKSFTGFVKDGEGVVAIATAISGSFKVIATAANFVSTVVGAIGRGLAGIASAFVAIWERRFNEGTAIAKKTLDDLLQTFSNHRDRFNAIWSDATADINDFADAFGSADFRKAAPGLKDTAKAAREAATAFGKLAQEREKALAELIKGIEDQELNDFTQQVQQLADAWQRVADIEGDVFSDTAIQDALDRTGAGVKIVNKELEDGKRLAEDMGNVFVSAFEDAVIGGKKFSDVLKGLSDDIARIILRMTVTKPLQEAVSGFDWRKLGTSIVSGLFGGSSGSTDVGQGAPGSIDTRAAGGPVTGGRPYLVGERGPELFLPSTVQGAIPKEPAPALEKFYKDQSAFVTKVSDTNNTTTALPMWVGARGPELFIPRMSGDIIPNAPSVSVLAKFQDEQTKFEGMSKGGPVDAARPVIVGEKGAELFVPKMPDLQSGALTEFNAVQNTFTNKVKDIPADTARPRWVGEAGAEWIVPKISGSVVPDSPALGKLYNETGGLNAELPLAKFYDESGRVSASTTLNDFSNEFTELPARAKGGPVSGGRSYVVGEKGPEVFTPNVSGQVTSNSDMVGGDTYNIDARGADPGQLKRLEAMIKTLSGAVPNIAISAITNARKRGFA